MLKPDKAFPHDAVSTRFHIRFMFRLHESRQPPRWLRLSSSTSGICQRHAKCHEQLFNCSRPGSHDLLHIPRARSRLQRQKAENLPCQETSCAVQECDSIARLLRKSTRAKMPRHFCFRMVEIHSFSRASKFISEPSVSKVSCRFGEFPAMNLLYYVSPRFHAGTVDVWVVPDLGISDAE